MRHLNAEWLNKILCLPTVNAIFAYLFTFSRVEVKIFDGKPLRTSSIPIIFRYKAHDLNAKHLKSEKNSISFLPL